MMVTFFLRRVMCGGAGQAEALFKRALEVDPTHPRTVENYAKLLIDNKKDLEQGIELLRRCGLTSVRFPCICCWVSGP